MPPIVLELLEQAGKAVVYYALLVSLIRMAGKRLAGQTTTFDLIVLISLGVVLQTTALQPGIWNAVVFIGTVFVVHRTLAGICARHPAVRRIIRGKPRVLVRNGRVVESALERESIGREELSAGLRKLGHDTVEGVRLAVLEETGHISAIAFDEAAHTESRPVTDRRDG